MQWTPEVKIYVQRILNELQKSNNKARCEGNEKLENVIFPLWMVQHQQKDGKLRVLSNEAKFRYIYGVLRPVPKDQEELKKHIDDHKKEIDWQTIDTQYHTVFVCPDFSWSSVLTLDYKNELMYSSSLNFHLRRGLSEEEVINFSYSTEGNQVVMKVTLRDLEHSLK